MKNESKKNIVVIGYPKSGTTWLSRLVAELLDCPLQGNWGFDNTISPLREGIDRISSYDCYKSHFLYEDLDRSQIFKIIYIIRDPRDVVISGINFFGFSYDRLRRTNSKFSNYLVSQISKWAFPYSKKKKLMIDAILNGDESVNEWLKYSWEYHLNSFRKAGVLLIKYEDLKQNTFDKSVEILSYLGVEKSESYINESIENQSIEAKKSQYANSNNIVLKKTVGLGKSDYWINEFENEEKLLFENRLGKELKKLKYRNTN